MVSALGLCARERVLAVTAPTDREPLEVLGNRRNAVSGGWAVSLVLKRHRPAPCSSDRRVWRR